MSNAKDKVQKLRPIDDVFFEKLIEDKGVCEEILRVILKDPKLEVLSVTPQSSIKNLWGRSVRLDAFCKLQDGGFCNIEVQKSDNDDHVRRVRYNAACITSNNTKAGSNFLQVPNVTMIYISAFDVFGNGKTIYHCATVCEETDEVVDNGLREIYVNTAINDGSTIAELMDCFKQTNVNNKKFPMLSQKVWYFKNDEGGVNTMCKVMEDYAKEQVNEAVLDEQKKRVKLVFDLGCSIEKAIEMCSDIPRNVIDGVYSLLSNQKIDL